MLAETKNAREHVVPEVCITDLLKRVLVNFAHELLADTVAVYSYSHELHEATLLASTPSDAMPFMVGLVENFCQTGNSSATISESALSESRYASAQLLVLRLYAEPIGALVLLSRSKSVNHLSHPSLPYYFAAIEGLLQNEYRRNVEDTLAAIKAMGHQVGEGATPQELATILGEQLLSPYVRYCAILLYGPRRDDRPNGPYAYLDMQGVWSNRLGTGIGSGMRLYLDQYTELLKKIDERKFLHIPDVRAIEGLFDPLVKGFLRNSGVQSMVFISLESAGRKLGLMTMGTESNHEFTQGELRTYQTISEFIGIRAMAHILKQEEDVLMRGRAALLDAMNDGVLMVLPGAGSVSGDANKTTVLTVNNTFTTLFSVPQIRAHGMTLPQLLTKMQLPDDVRQTLSTHWLSIGVRDPTPQRGDFTMTHPEGYQTSIAWYSALVKQGSRVMGRIYVFHNVMEDHSAVSLRANFVSRMSHELRTPLTSIKGFAQYILEEFGAELTPVLHDYLEIIFDNSQLLNSLFSDIIEITRADVGDLKLNIIPVDFVGLVEQVVLAFEGQGAKERKWIELRLAENMPPALLDTNYISRVMSLFLSNAFQHAPEDTAITISSLVATTPKQLPFGAPADVLLPCIVVLIEDQGEGIAAEDAELIFQPFYRTRDSRVTRKEGSGLGLPLARSILTLHRGKTWAEPRRRGKRGARMYFTLPIDGNLS